MGCWIRKLIGGGAQAAQSAHAAASKDSQAEAPAQEKALVLQGSCAFLRDPQDQGMGGTGIEHYPKNSGNIPVSSGSGAESGARGAREAVIEPAFGVVIESWPALPEPIKAGILAMIRVSGSAG